MQETLNRSNGWTLYGKTYQKADVGHLHLHLSAVFAPILDAAEKPKDPLRGDSDTEVMGAALSLCAEKPQLIPGSGGLACLIEFQPVFSLTTAM